MTVTTGKCWSKGRVLSPLIYWETWNLETCSWSLRLSSKEFSFLRTLSPAGSPAFCAHCSLRRGWSGHGGGSVVPGNVSRQGLGCLATCVCRGLQTAQPFQWTACQGMSESFCRALENWLGLGGGVGANGGGGGMACCGPQRQEHKFFSLKQSWNCWQAHKKDWLEPSWGSFSLSSVY